MISRAIVKILVAGCGVTGLIFAIAGSASALPREGTFHCSCECSYEGKVDHTVNFDAADCGVAVGTVCQVEVGPNHLIRQGSITGCLGTAVNASSAARAAKLWGTMAPPKAAPPGGGVIRHPILPGAIASPAADRMQP